MLRLRLHSPVTVLHLAMVATAAAAAAAAAQARRVAVLRPAVAAAALARQCCAHHRLQELGDLHGPAAAPHSQSCMYMTGTQLRVA